MRIGPVVPCHQQQSGDGLSPVKSPSDPGSIRCFGERLSSTGSIQIGVKQTMTPSLIAGATNSHSESDPALTLQTQNIFRLVRMAEGASENLGGTAGPGSEYTGLSVAAPRPLVAHPTTSRGNGWIREIMEEWWSRIPAKIREHPLSISALNKRRSELQAGLAACVSVHQERRKAIEIARARAASHVSFDTQRG